MQRIGTHVSMLMLRRVSMQQQTCMLQKPAEAAAEVDQARWGAGRCGDAAGADDSLALTSANKW
jgi:hypothetical protein